MADHSTSPKSSAGQFSAASSPVNRINSPFRDSQSNQSLQGEDAADRLLPGVFEERILNPLIIEYEKENHALKSQLKDISRHFSEMDSQISRLIAENERLRTDLKDNVFSQLNDLKQVEEKYPPPTDGDELLRNMQTQVQLLDNEKRNIFELWQNALHEIEKLEDELESMRSAAQPEFEQLEYQLSRMNAQHVRTVVALQAQIEDLQNQLRSRESELGSCRVQIKQLNQALDQARAELQKKTQDRQVAVQGQLESMEATKDLVDVMDRLEHQNRKSSQELGDLKRRNMELEDSIQKLTGRIQDLMQREQEAVFKLKESSELVQAALMERDNVLIREKQQQEENRRLQAAVSDLMEEAGKRTKEEVESVRIQCNRSIQKLVEEIQELEMDNIQKKTMIDRLQRDKRVAEDEIVRLNQLKLLQEERDPLESLNIRLVNAERARDDAMVRLDAAESALRTLEQKYNSERTQHDVMYQQMKERLAKLHSELTQLNDDRLRILAENDELKSKMNALREEKEQSQRKLTQEMQLLQNEMNNKMNEHETRANSFEENHQTTVQGLREMIMAQTQLSQRWKHECQSLSKKYDEKYNELKSQNVALKKRNDDYRIRMEEEHRKELEKEAKITELQCKLAKLQIDARAAEEQATEATKKLNSHMLKEKLLMMEKHFLETEFERNVNITMAQSRMGLDGVDERPLTPQSQY